MGCSSSLNSSTNRWVRRSMIPRNHSSSCSSTGYSTIVTNTQLVKAGAWNVRRLQNMILIVGPGTPAWNVDGADDDDERRMNNGRESPSSSSSPSSVYSFSSGEDDEEEEDDDDRRFLYRSDVDDDTLLHMDSNYHDAEIEDDDDVDDYNTTTTSKNNNRHQSNWELNRTSTIALSTNITQSPTVAVVEGCEHQQSCDSCCEEEKECNERNDTYTKARSSF
jgi:hypothetical protein